MGPQNVGPQNPNLIPCSQWNTTAALSQTNADVNMHNTLAQLTLALRPRNDLTVNAGFKFYRQDYYNDYLAYNPFERLLRVYRRERHDFHGYGYPTGYHERHISSRTPSSSTTELLRICSRWTTTMSTAD